MVSKSTFWLLLMTSPALFALQPDLGEMGYPFSGKGVQIVWEAPMDKLPTTLAVLRVTPRLFPLEVISNVVALAQFRDPEAALAALKPASQGKRASYEEPKPLKGICITPESGYISLNNSAAVSPPRKPVERVPSKPETLRLALALLPKLGIEQSELARKPESSELQLAHILGEQGGLAKHEGRATTRTNLQGVILGQAVNGIAFSGRGDCGSVRVEFGNHGLVANLAVVWRNLRPDHNVPVVSKAQILQWIKDGKAIISEGVEGGQITKLTVTRIVPCYLGKDPAEKQKFVYPYAELTANAHMGTRNATVTLTCPLFQ
jgi:hypothetical protein